MPPLPASTNRSSAEAPGQTVIAGGTRRHPTQSAGEGKGVLVRTGNPIADVLHASTSNIPRYSTSFIHRRPIDEAKRKEASR